METLIGLLFILLPVIFKLIGKKLENSGNTEAAKTLEYEIVRPVKEEPTKVEVAKPKAAKAQPAKAVAKTVEAPETAKEKEKIDLKKLIVYSEIMKPKYEE
ncbi:MAG: hypothetical protein IKW27_10840 [Bacteroidales bacterium]|nr:hypothetical protein [Bacteroidales bacterium]